MIKKITHQKSTINRDQQVTNETSFDVLDNGTIVLNNKKITKSKVVSALKTQPKKVVFTDNVQQFDMLAFSGVNCLPFDFSTAKNLSKIGSSCFKNAYNVIWTSTLDLAESATNSFDNIRIIAKIEDDKILKNK